MSYRLLLCKDGYSLNKSWFNNSWFAMDDIRKAYEYDPHTLYEKIYNVKIVRGKRMKDPDYVEFPSEEEATMFVLKWS